MNLERWRKRLHQGEFPYVYSREGGIKKVKQILNMIEFGAQIGYMGDRSQSRSAHNLRSATSTPEIERMVSEIIAADVAAGKKAGPFDTPPFSPFSVSPIGAVPKGGSWDRIRVIHHLSFPKGGDSINANIMDEELKLDSFDQACEAIRSFGEKLCLLIKLDVEAAYKQIAVHPLDRPLLGFQWQGKYYYELVLPFGLKSSGARWELIARALKYFFRHHLGIQLVIVYVDDFLFVVPDEVTGNKQKLAARELAEELGTPMASEDGKDWGPTTCLIFLGIELDTGTKQMRIPAAKLLLLQQLLFDWVQNRNYCTIHDLQSLIGKLYWAAQVIRQGRAFLRRLIDFTSQLRALEEKEEAKAKERGITQRYHHRHRSHRISESARLDIRWWHRCLNEDFNNHSLMYDIEWTNNTDSTLLLFTDACCDPNGNGGFGASYGNRWIQGRWSPEQVEAARRKGGRISIPQLELHALVLAICTWSHNGAWRGRRILIRCDAQTVCHGVEKLSCKHSMMQGLIRHLTLTAAKGGFQLKLVHIKGEKNEVADLLSRKFPISLSVLRQVLPGAEEKMDSILPLPPLMDM
ncbi:MAG TPA: reverse transcriptase domain-containing protein [Candidatus Babeliaceae bacterium]|nr:reverse transcriptase domain-containing protein [Candidatus Babeliaceae bacterium]